MEQGYLAQVQALIDQKWKENPEEMKRVMEDIEAKEKANKEKPKVEKLTQELIEEITEEYWDDIDISKLKALIEKGANVNAKDSNGWTPLVWASWKNHITIAELFLEAGADLEAKDNEGQTPLHWASVHDSIAIAELLLNRGANLEAKDVNGETPLDLARSDEMEALLKGYQK